MRSEGNSRKWRTNSWFLLHDNAPAHRSVFSYQRTTWQDCSIPHTQLSPADVYPFPRLELALKGRRFCDATDIIKNATEELKRLSQNGFQECFQHLHSQKCIDARRVPFWRKCSFGVCTVLYFSEIKLCREHSEANAYIRTYRQDIRIRVTVTWAESDKKTGRKTAHD